MKIHWANWITMMNLSCGFIALCLGDIILSPIFILLGALFDLFDGAVARWQQTEGVLGVQLDSLADCVTFGVAPAYLYCIIQPASLAEELAIAACAILLIGTVYRLAVFNILPSSSTFIGLPSPTSGIFFATLVFASSHEGTLAHQVSSHAIIYLLLPAGFAILMNSKLLFFSLKQNLSSLRKMAPLLLLALVGIVMCWYSPFDMPIVVIFFYIVLAMIKRLFV